LDVRRDNVVYEAKTRFARRLFQHEDPTVARSLVVGALKSLLQRPKFQAIVRQKKRAAKPQGATTVRSFARCAAPEIDMLGDAERVLAAAVVVRSGSAVGSGFFFSPDGLLLSAAHVVEAGDVRVRLRNGAELPASLVRLVSDTDVVLLRVDGQRTAPCLPLDTAFPEGGSRCLRGWQSGG
jgi:S1-C subfamily serine protease